MSDQSCPRLGKVFGGCKFSPRYDTVWPLRTDPMDGFWYTRHGGARPVPSPAKSTYLGDVCTTCGKTLFRRKQPAKAAP